MNDTELLEGEEWQTLRHFCNQCNQPIFSSKVYLKCQSCEKELDKATKAQDYADFLLLKKAVASNASVEIIGQIIDKTVEGNFNFRKLREFAPIEPYFGFSGDPWPVIHTFVQNLKRFRAEILLMYPERQGWLDHVLLEDLAQLQAKEAIRVRKAKAEARRNEKAKRNS